MHVEYRLLFFSLKNKLQNTSGGQNCLESYCMHAVMVILLLAD